MAAREFQRFFGQCAGGRETDNRAKQACDDAAARPLRKLPTSLHANKCTADRNGSTTRATVSLGAVERRWRPVSRCWQKTEIVRVQLFSKTRVNYFPPWTIPISAPTTLSVAVRKRFAASARCRGAAPF
jgi:hypothetical protein